MSKEQLEAVSSLEDFLSLLPPSKREKLSDFDEELLEEMEPKELSSLCDFLSVRERFTLMRLSRKRGRSEQSTASDQNDEELEKSIAMRKAGRHMTLVEDGLATDRFRLLDMHPSDGGGGDWLTGGSVEWLVVGSTSSSQRDAFLSPSSANIRQNAVYSSHVPHGLPLFNNDDGSATTTGGGLTYDDRDVTNSIVDMYGDDREDDDDDGNNADLAPDSVDEDSADDDRDGGGETADDDDDASPPSMEAMTLLVEQEDLLRELQARVSRRLRSLQEVDRHVFGPPEVGPEVRVQRILAVKLEEMLIEAAEDKRDVQRFVMSKQRYHRLDEAREHSTTTTSSRRHHHHNQQQLQQQLQQRHHPREDLLRFPVSNEVRQQKRSLRHDLRSLSRMILRLRDTMWDFLSGDDDEEE